MYSRCSENKARLVRYLALLLLPTCPMFTEVTNYLSYASTVFSSHNIFLGHVAAFRDFLDLKDINITLIISQYFQEAAGI